MYSKVQVILKVRTRCIDPVDFKIKEVRCLMMDTYIQLTQCTIKTMIAIRAIIGELNHICGACTGDHTKKENNCLHAACTGDYAKREDNCIHRACTEDTSEAQQT